MLLGVEEHLALASHLCGRGWAGKLAGPSVGLSWGGEGLEGDDWQTSSADPCSFLSSHRALTSTVSIVGCVHVSSTPQCLHLVSWFSVN